MRIPIFAVVLGKLVLQSLTIKPLIRRMGLTDDDPLGRAAARRSRKVPL